MVRRCVSTVLPIDCFWKNRPPQTGEHMVEVKRIKAPSDIPAEGSYVLVLYGPSAMDREHPRGRTLMVRDGKRDNVKLDEFAAAVETAKALAETKHFQTVYVIDEADAKRTIGYLSFTQAGADLFA